MTAATIHAPEPVPWRLAAAVALAVLAGYLATLAPTVTFWDAGEFIAAARTLGIPHPPGTPLFVLVAHVWGTLVPAGEFAFRTNLLSATMSAVAAGFFALVAWQSLRQAGLDARLRQLGAAAAALVGAFTFTNWQNSNETEVYALATATIAACAFLVLRWREARGTPRGVRILLLVVYLLGLSIGNHLLALLAGPAVVAALAHAAWATPLADPQERRREQAKVLAIAGLWALMVGTGLGSVALLRVGALAFAVLAALAAARGAGGFVVAALGLAALGVTPYLFLYLRAAQHPPINEADPSTWQALLDVIRRKQYPARTPFDDPTIPSGPDNPGRSLGLMGLQLLNYLQYFDWQWAKGVAARAGDFPLRTLGTLLFTALGLRGFALQRRADRTAWWLCVTLFAVTGLGLMAYMNFKPGFSVGWADYPEMSQHEVRERDYFFVVSFVVWGLWAGLGLAGLVARLGQSARGAARLAPALLLLALAPFALNFTAASRRGPDRTLAADLAYNLLNSAPPYGILFTYGDNDTFPLWWAQEVAGIRRDVTVVCLALANTDWYLRQLRDARPAPFDAAAAPAPWREEPAAAPPDWPLHTLTDADIASMTSSYSMVSQATVVDMGLFRHTIPANTVLAPSDVAVLRIVQQSAGRRPIVWAVTAGREFSGLGAYVAQTGMGYRLVGPLGQPDSARSLFGPPLDVPLTERLAWETYRYGTITADQVRGLDPSSAAMANALAGPFTRLAVAAEGRGDTAAVLKNLERAASLSPDEGLADALAKVRAAAGR